MITKILVTPLSADEDEPTAELELDAAGDDGVPEVTELVGDELPHAAMPSTAAARPAVAHHRVRMTSPFPAGSGALCPVNGSGLRLRSRHRLVCVHVQEFRSPSMPGSGPGNHKG
jgi:hypothetical protein